MSSRNYIHRAISFFTGMILVGLLTCCDRAIIEPEPIKTVTLYSGYSIQLTTSSVGQWVSDNLSVATVSSTGLVTAVGAGTATIYTYSSKGEDHIVCYLEVFPKRNILFYMATDGNTSDFIDGDTPKKIDSIRAGWKPDQGEMLIYADRKGKGASLLRINSTFSNGYYGLDTLENYGIENSANAAVLSRMIDTLLSYPADSYGLIFFSHASGWLPTGTFNYPRSSETDPQHADLLNPNEVALRSLVIDYGGGSRQEMEYVDFAAAIPDNRLDFIIIEACLMADVISLYELRNKAKYILASSAEIVSPGFSYIYKNEIMRLYDTNNSVFSVVSDFAQACYDYLVTQFPENSVSCSLTLGMIKMDEMQNLATSVKAALNGALLDESTLPVDQIQRYDRLKSINNGRQGYRYFDLAHVIENLATGSQYQAFCTQLDKTVVWKANTKRYLLGNYGNGAPYYAEYDGFFIERHCGLSTYISQSAYPFLNEVYENSAWYKAIY